MFQVVAVFRHQYFTR